jgi:RNA polymerase sigma factor for flagellar operon FliA
MTGARFELRDQEPSGEADEGLLWRAHLNGEAGARERLFAVHLPFARRVASRYYRQRSRGDIEFADLFQLACAGLLEAIDGFDPARGVPFRGYAARRVTGSVIDGIGRMTEVREQMSFRRRVQRDRLASLLPAGEGNGASESALAALADLAVGLAVGFLLEGTGFIAGEEAADPAPGPYEGLALKRMVCRMREEIGSLDERERAILHYHYEDGLVFDQIGDLLGITKGRVSQLHRSALTRLRKRLKGAGHFRLEG